MKTLIFPKINAFTKTIALVAVMTASYAAHAQDDAPNPFANLRQAQQQVTSYEKADPNGPIDLKSTDVDFTLGRLSTVLTLTPAQKSTVHSILDAQKNRIASAEQDKSLAPAARNTRITAVYRDTASRIDDALTTDQLLKAKVIQANTLTDSDETRAEKLFMFDARFAAMSPAESVTQWGNVLNLTATQKLSLLPTLENEASQLDAIAADKTLSADDSRIKTQEIMVATEQKIDAQLTPDQQKHLESALLLGQAPSTANPRAMVARH